MGNLKRTSTEANHNLNRLLDKLDNLAPSYIHYKNIFLGFIGSDAKGESRAEAPWSDRVPMRNTGAESFVVALKAL